MATMGLCRTVYEINGNFSRKSFPTPVFFKFFQHADNQFQWETRMLGRKDQAYGFPLELGTGA